VDHCNYACILGYETGKSTTIAILNTSLALIILPIDTYLYAFSLKGLKKLVFLTAKV
jgi:hypothetical protein